MSQPPLPPNKPNSPVPPSHSRFSAGFQPVRSRHLRRKRELLTSANQIKQQPQPIPSSATVLPSASTSHPSLSSHPQIPLTPKWLVQPSPPSLNHSNPIANRVTPQKGPLRSTPIPTSSIKPSVVNPNPIPYHANVAPLTSATVKPSAHKILSDHAFGNLPQISQYPKSQPNPSVKGVVQNDLISADRSSGMRGKTGLKMKPIRSVNTNPTQQKASEDAQGERQLQQRLMDTKKVQEGPLLHENQGQLAVSRAPNIQTNSATYKPTSTLHDTQACTTKKRQGSPINRRADHHGEDTNASAQQKVAEKRQRTDIQQSLLDSLQPTSPGISPLSLGPSYADPHRSTAKLSQVSKPSLLQYSDLDDPNAGVVPTAANIALDPPAVTSQESQQTPNETQNRPGPKAVDSQMPSSGLTQPDLDTCKDKCAEREIHFLHPAIAQDVSLVACRAHSSFSLVLDQNGHSIISSTQIRQPERTKPPLKANPLPKSSPVQEMQIDVHPNVSASRQIDNALTSSKTKERTRNTRLALSLGDRMKENITSLHNNPSEVEQESTQRESMDVDRNPAKTSIQKNSELVGGLTFEQRNEEPLQTAHSTGQIIDEDGDLGIQDSSVEGTLNRPAPFSRHMMTLRSSHVKQLSHEAGLTETISLDTQKNLRGVSDQDLSKQDTSNQEMPNKPTQPLQPEERSKDTRCLNGEGSFHICDNMSQIQALQQRLQAFIEVSSSHSNPSGHFALPAMNLMGMSLSRFTAREHAIYLAGWAGGVISMTGGQSHNGVSSDQISPFPTQQIFQAAGQDGDADKTPVHERQSKQVVQSKPEKETNTKELAGNAIVLNDSSTQSREVLSTADKDSLERDKIRSLTHGALFSHNDGIAKPARCDQRAESKSHQEKITTPKPNADPPPTEKMGPGSKIKKMLGNKTTSGPKKLIEKTRITNNTNGKTMKAKALKETSAERYSPTSSVSNEARRKETAQKQGPMSGKAFVHSARTGEDAYAARARLTEMMRAKTGEETYAARAKLTQQVDRERRVPENQNIHNSNKVAAVRSAQTGEEAYGTRARMTEKTRTVQPGGDATHNSDSFETVRSAQTGEEAYAARARMTEMMRNAQTGEDAYAARARMTEMMRSQPTSSGSRRDLEGIEQTTGAICTAEYEDKCPRGRHSGRKRTNRSDRPQAPSRSPIVIDLDSDDVSQQPKKVQVSKSRVMIGRRQSNSPPPRQLSIREHENSALVHNTTPGYRSSREENAGHSATTRELRPTVGTGTYLPSTEVIEIPPDDPKEEHHQVMLTRYGLVAIIRNEKTKNITWMACRFCPVYGCRTKEKNHIQLYQAPFLDSQILRHLKEEHGEWPEYDRASADVKRKMFVGRTLPPRETFVMRIEEIQKQGRS